ACMSHSMLPEDLGHADRPAALLWLRAGARHARPASSAAPAAAGLLPIPGLAGAGTDLPTRCGILAGTGWLQACLAVATLPADAGRSAARAFSGTPRTTAGRLAIGLAAGRQPAWT